MSSDSDAPAASRWQRFRDRCARWWRRIHPGERALAGAELAGLLALAFVAAALGTKIRLGLSAFFDPVLGAICGLLLAIVISLGVRLVLMLLKGVPRWLGGKGVIYLLTLAGVLTLIDFPPPVALMFAAVIILIQAILGGALAGLLGSRWREAAPRRRLWLALLVTLALAANVLIVTRLARDGSDEHLSDPAGESLHQRAERLSVAPLAAPDPSKAGPFEVLTLTYGSGTDRRRAEFGSGADLITESVDGTPFVKDNEGWRIDFRHRYWGFDFESLPRNGRVFHPEGEGPFPLVLIVHGNHNMQEFSDPGYAYLGELLASRGFIFVSVDENFLNGSWIGGLDTENDARGWMLLQHLALWRAWAADPQSPFHGKVDMSRIALIGHSRGGEAAAIAGSFNRLDHYPDDATVDFDFDFDIRAIIAIAPSDGQYEPADQPTPLTDVDYLTLQGGHDADVSVFVGARQFRRVAFTGGAYHFKAYLYAYRANHGQFNTEWGRYDSSWPSGFFLNVEPLLDADEQRRIGMVAISAFLEASLHGETDYLPFFRNPEAAAAWLPEDIYLSRFQDSTFRPLADYEEDIDVTTASLEGTTIEGDGLAVWREEDLALRKRGTKDNQVAFVGWRRGESAPPSYSLLLPEGSGMDLTADSLLVLSLADADEKPPDEDEDEEGDDQEDSESEEDESEDEPREALDFTIELVSTDGHAAALPLSRFGGLPKPLYSRFLKLPEGQEKKLYGSRWEPTLKLFELPLADFAAENPAFEPSRLSRIRLVFDRGEDGVVIVDDVGFAEPPRI
ncbi:MAG: hypothetical protein GY719_37945 [bacterium]|nr:hypothetical protein [bacterium]